MSTAILNTKLPHIILKMLSPYLKDEPNIRLMPEDLYVREQFFEHNGSAIYYSELKLLIVDYNIGHLTLIQFRKNSSDDINIKTYGFTPCLNP